MKIKEKLKIYASAFVESLPTIMMSYIVAGATAGWICFFDAPRTRIKHEIKLEEYEYRLQALEKEYQLTDINKEEK